ncbi:MAG: M23 family metallopeptidase [Proteobacteria bacterium]|nr:M23 family metallopeptidase [Pseudomonadota bacterium]
MKIIIISPNSTIHKHWHFTRNKMIVACLVLTAILSSSGLWFYQKINAASKPVAEHISQLATPTTEVSNNDVTTAEEVQPYYVKRLGGLQAEAIRLKALMEKLASMAGLNTVPYSLDTVPPQGGIDDSGLQVGTDEFDDKLLELEKIFSQQSLQLTMIQDYLITEDAIESAIPMGKPVKSGWISSYYGYRLDPFNGKKTFHHGLDFAGKSGSDVNTVADGIVSWTGNRNGYGQMVEIEHGNGYITRYAHNKSLTVAKGDRVEKGQQIALMGSTGRSTGPHVHFEVLLDGKTVNPYNFVK